MTEMCDRCPRTPVTDVPSLYRSQPGHPATSPKSNRRSQFESRSIRRKESTKAVIEDDGEEEWIAEYEDPA